MGKEYDSGRSIYRIGPMYFRKWFSYFFAEYYEEYRQYCSSGSIKKEKTLKRIEIMEDSLIKYFELNNDTVQETDSLSDETASMEEDLSNKDDATLSEDNIDGSNVQEVCESNSEAESQDIVEKPPEEMSEDKETA